MTSTGYQPGPAIPLTLGPNLSPADAVHIPRWLDELVDVGAKAAHDLLRTVDIRRAPSVDLTPAEQGQLCAYLEDKWGGT